MQTGERVGSDAVQDGPQYPIASVDRALRLLLAVCDDQSLRLSDASRILGVANSTAHRLLAMLMHHDLIQQNPRNRTYAPGPALVRIGLSVLNSFDIRRLARPILEQLCKDLDETVHLAVRDGTDVHYLDALESSKALRVASRVGASLPANCTSVGKALLAELTSEELHRLYPALEPLPAQTASSITSLSELEDQLARIRARGYATNYEESELGVTSIAMAVHSPSGGATATISVATPVVRMSDEHRRTIVAALSAATAELGRSMPDVDASLLRQRSPMDNT